MTEIRERLAWISKTTPSLGLLQRVLAFEKLETRSLLVSLAGLAKPTGNMLRFDFGRDNTSQNVAVSQFFGFSALNNAAGSIGIAGSNAPRIHDRAFAGDWSNTGFSSIGIARLTPSTKPAKDDQKDWVFLLASDGDNIADYAFRFGSNIDARKLSEADLPIPLIGNFDGRYGTDIAVARTIKGANNQTGWEWELNWSRTVVDEKGTVLPSRYLNLYPEPECNGNLAFCAPLGDALKPTPILKIDARFSFGKFVQNTPSDPLILWSQPVVGDFDFDGRDDVAIATLRKDGSDSSNGTLSFEYLTSGATDIPYMNGQSYIKSSGTREIRLLGLLASVKTASVVFGDLNGDAKSDFLLVIDNGNKLNWSQIDSKSISFDSSKEKVLELGSSGDQPLVGNWVEGLWKSDAQVTQPRSESRLLDKSLWVTGSVPLNTQNLIINNRASGIIVIDGPLVRTAATSITNPVEIRGGTQDFGGETTFENLIITSGTVKFSGKAKIKNLTLSAGTVQFTGESTIGALSVSGNGRVEINVAQVFSSVAIDGGTVIVGYPARDNPFGTTASVTILSSGTILAAAIPENVALQTASKYLLSNNFNFPVSGDLTLGNALSTAADAGTREQTSYLQIAGSISGPGTLRKSGKGSLLLTGDNSYTGATTVDEGELIAGSSNALGATSGATRMNAAD